MVATNLLLSALVLVTLCASGICSKSRCTDHCCLFLDNIPGKLKSLRDYFEQIKPYYEANDELDTVLLDDGVLATINSRFGCHVVNEVLRFYRDTVLPAAKNDTQENQKFQASIQSIGDALEKITRDIIRCKKHFACLEPFHIQDFKKTYNQMEKKQGMFKAMGELDVLFNFIEEYMATKRRRH